MATILIVDDDTTVRETMAETVEDLGHRAVGAASAPEALSLIRGGQTFAGIFLDLRMPGKFDGMELLRRLAGQTEAPPVVVLTAFASASNTIEAMQLGAQDHLTKPAGREDLALALKRMLDRPVSPLAEDHVQDHMAGADDIIGTSDGIRQVQKMIGLSADSDATILISGETGTGKEIVARTIHAHSRRKKQPFIPVNCAAIPSELLESELFGHVRGSFTGAIADRRGAFREANGGTLFLDEIGDMPVAMQAKILRVLQDRVIVPVGGRPEALDIRLLAATHRDLPGAVAAGTFRQDLFYRLNVVPIGLPPLRERLADIVLLAEHFLTSASTSRTTAKRLGSDAASRLLAHSWPGNVRELRNVIERATVLGRGDVIRASDLDLGQPDSSTQGDWLAGDLPTAVARLEKAMIQRALAIANGSRAEAARSLGIQRQLLYAKMERYGLTDVSGNTT